MRAAFLLPPILLGLLVAAPPAAAAPSWLWPPPLELAGELASADYGTLADFDAHREGSVGGSLDRPRNYRYGYEGGQLSGFRLGLRLHPQLVLRWSRLYGESRYEASVDGQPLAHDPGGLPPVQLPDVDLRADWITLAMSSSRLEWKGVQPVLQLGYGWLLQSQQARPDQARAQFQPLGRPPRNYSDSDRGIEVGAGLRWRWRALRVGADLRSFHWRWAPDDQYVPERTVHLWAGSLWAGVGLF